MIAFPKLLIAAVNGKYEIFLEFEKNVKMLTKFYIAKKKGPAIGFGTTTLGLCDVVYCTPETTFSTPFMKLGNYYIIHPIPPFYFM